MNSTGKIQSVGVIGHFAKGINMADGQVVKTRTVYELLCDVCGDANVRTVDTHRWQKHPLAIAHDCIALAGSSDALVMLPAHNGLKVFAPLLAWLKKRYGCKLIYSVIGGWLPEFIEGHTSLIASLKSFDAILVESDRMKTLLIEQGFDNVGVSYNYKHLPRLDVSDLKRPIGEPWPIAVFSRIYAGKGIDDIVWAIDEANSRFGRRVFKLDIYGRVLLEYKDHFKELMEGCDSSAIAYKGVVPANESVSTLNGYLALAFPTRCSGEGVPGTVVDSYSAGVPVIASRWPSYSEMVDEDVTGITFGFCDRDALLGVLLDSDLPARLLSMKEACLNKSSHYSYDAGIAEVERLIESGFDVRG